MTEEKKTTTTRKPAATKHKSLVEALVAFQADLPVVLKDAKNPHFKNSYASLEKLMTEVTPVLSAHGLAYNTTSQVSETGLLTVTAKLTHESGEFETASFPVPETAPQKIGSAVSYFRRYGLGMLTGVVSDEDDDGNAASAPAPQPLQGARQKAAAMPSAAPQGEADKLKAQIRTWIGGDDQKREKAIEVTEKFKAEGKTGVDLQHAIIKELGA